MNLILYLLAGIGVCSLLAAAAFLAWVAWLGRRAERAFGLDGLIRYRVAEREGRRVYTVGGRSEAEIAERFLRIAAHEGPGEAPGLHRGGSWKW